MVPSNVSKTSLIILITVQILSLNVVEAGLVPGVKMTTIEVWENSQLEGVFAPTYSNEYLNFRAYCLSMLSDAGYFDHLLTALVSTGETLRNIDSIGIATGIVVVLRGTAARQTRQSAATTTPDPATATATVAPLPDLTLLTLDMVKKRSIQIVKRMLLRGPVTRLLDHLIGIAGNVLLLFLYLDSRYRPISVQAQEEVRQRYSAWCWDMALDFYTNVSNLQSCVAAFDEVDLTSEKPTLKRRWEAFKLALLRVLPSMQCHIDYVEGKGQCMGGAVFTLLNWLGMEEIMHLRYNRIVPQPVGDSGRMERQSFIATTGTGSGSGSGSG